ncbi:MAG TPA: hypothetical protein VH302_07575 [Bryobacteraceae bacterium]|nr:hypothetical protein [Bryobacteraceae bacterium]
MAAFCVNAAYLALRTNLARSWTGAVRGNAFDSSDAGSEIRRK